MACLPVRCCGTVARVSRYGTIILRKFETSQTRQRLTHLNPHQIGVQSVYEDVARDTNRGHTVRATCESFQMAKDAGFKVVSHMMVRLVSSTDRTSLLRRDI